MRERRRSAGGQNERKIEEMEGDRVIEMIEIEGEKMRGEIERERSNNEKERGRGEGSEGGRERWREREIGR